MSEEPRGRHAAPTPPEGQPAVADEGGSPVKITRFPALTLGVLSGLVQVVVGLFTHLTPEQTSAVNALVVAVLGLVTAWLVKGDALVAAITGVGQAVLALMLGFGLALSPELQASIMALVSALAAAFVHTQVIGPVPPVPGSSPLEPRPQHEAAATEEAPVVDGPWQRAR